MALKKLVFQPGINRDRTDYSSEGGWYAADKIRFRQGYPEKIGGWTPINFKPYTGEASTIIQYGTTDNNVIISIGTNEKNYVVLGTELYDITPIRVVIASPATDNCISTVDGSTTITFNIMAHGAAINDYVTISGATSVGGVPAGEINKEHKITNATTNTFDVSVETAATSTVAAGGGTAISASFQYPVGYPTTTFGYGWGAGPWGRSTWGSGSDVAVAFPPRLIFQEKFNNDVIYNIKGGDIFYWQYTPTISERAVELKTLTGSRAVPEQVGNIIFAFSGHLLAMSCTEYNITETDGLVISSLTRTTRLTTVTVTTVGSHNLKVNDWVLLQGQAPSAYQGEVQVMSVPTADTFTYEMAYDPGVDATTVGTYKSIDYSGDFDPLLIRWANVDPVIGPQPEEWKPELTNTAGFLRVQQGSQIVAAHRTRQEVLVWSDIALYTVQFLGTEEVFALQEISDSINIIGPNVSAEANNIIFWMGNDKFFAYDGRVSTLPCTLKQYVFEDMNKTNGRLNFAGINSEFNEVIWFYCSATSDSIDRYVIFNYEEKIWYYGTLARTAWANVGTIKFPLAANAGYVYRHEDGVDNVEDPTSPSKPITAFIESADIGIDDGDSFVLTKRVIPDVNFVNSSTSSPEVEVTVGVRNFPGARTDTDDVAGNTLTRDVVTTASVDTYTNQVFVRARGRQMNFKIASDTLGTQWQLGATRVDFRPDGRRG